MICDLTTRRFRCRTGRNSAQRARLFLTRWSSVGPMNVGTKMRMRSWFTSSAQRQSSPGAVRRQCGSPCIATRRGHQPAYTGQPPAPIKDERIEVVAPELGSDCARLPAAARPPLSGSTVKTGHTPTIGARCHRATVPLVTQGSPRTRLAPVAAGGGSRTCPKRTRGLRRVTAGRAGFTVPLSVRSSHEWSRPVKIVANLKPVELRDLRW